MNHTLQWRYNPIPGIMTKPALLSLINFVKVTRDGENERHLLAVILTPLCPGNRLYKLFVLTCVSLIYYYEFRYIDGYKRA
jgi:hypothetical protein